MGPGNKRASPTPGASSRGTPARERFWGPVGFHRHPPLRLHPHTFFSIVRQLLVAFPRLWHTRLKTTGSPFDQEDVSTEGNPLNLYQRHSECRWYWFLGRRWTQEDPCFLASLTGGDLYSDACRVRLVFDGGSLVITWSLEHCAPRAEFCATLLNLEVDGDLFAEIC